MHTIYISVGSNLGDRKANLKFALASLNNSGTVRSVSSFFETEPVGYLDQPWFLNIAVEFETALTVSAMLELCKSIEESCGRIRTFPNAPRTLDVDILLYDDIVMKKAELTIPHPRMQDRRFVLEPLAQIAPDVVHPAAKKSIRSLLEECPDRSQVIKK